jgi:hypothetical protein
MLISIGAGTTESGGYLRPKEPEVEPAQEHAPAVENSHGH